jgi:tetratricopeptide (TPR) repeat protein
LKPDHARALNDLSWILAEKKNDVETALEYANMGIAHHPDHVNLLDTRGVVLFRLDRLEEAKVDFQRCIDLTENDPRPNLQHTRAQALFHLGRLYAKQKNSTRAKEQLEAAMEIDSRLGVFTSDQSAEIRDLTRALEQ